MASRGKGRTNSSRFDGEMQDQQTTAQLHLCDILPFCSIRCIPEGSACWRPHHSGVFDAAVVTALCHSWQNKICQDDSAVASQLGPPHTSMAQSSRSRTFIRLAEDGLCVGADAKIEYINLRAKEAVPLGLRSFEAISKAVLRLNVTDDVDRTVRSAFDLPQYLAADRNLSFLLPVEEKDLNDLTLLLGQHLKWSTKGRAADFDQIWPPERNWAADLQDNSGDAEHLRRDVAIFVNEETATVEDKLPQILSQAVASYTTSSSKKTVAASSDTESDDDDGIPSPSSHHASSSSDASDNGG